MKRFLVEDDDNQTPPEVHDKSGVTLNRTQNQNSDYLQLMGNTTVPVAHPNTRQVFRRQRSGTTFNVATSQSGPRGSGATSALGSNTDLRNASPATEMELTRQTYIREHLGTDNSDPAN